MTTIYLVRHGEAEGNAYRRIHGQYDSILTPTGFAQVKYVEERFREIPVDACFSSDLTRTSLTARSIYVPKGLPLQRRPDFREIQLGRWEDTPFGYLETFEPEEMRRFNREPMNWHVEGAETFQEYTGRFIGGMESAAAKYPGGTIAIFCHGAILRGTLARLFFGGDCARVPYCDNTAVSKLYWDGVQFTYEYLNDNSHVPQELSTFARQKWWRKGDNKDFNLWYAPMTELPLGTTGDVTFIAMLRDTPVGILSLDTGVGEITRLYLAPQYQSRTLEDQFLGQATSCLRRSGHTTIKAREHNVTPPQVLTRYGFQQTGDLYTKNIDPKQYRW